MKKPDVVSADAPQDRASFLAGYRVLLKRVKQEYNDPAVHLEMARFLIQHNRGDRAFSSLQVARALQPRRVETYYLLGWLHQREGNLEQAKQAYRQILQMQSDEVRAHFQLGCLLEQESDDLGAVKAFKKVISLLPSHAESYWHLGLLSRKMGDLPKAIKHLTALKALQPANHLVTFELGRCYQAMGVQDKAVVHLQNSIQGNPDHLPAKLALASVFLEGKAYPQAGELLQQILDRDPRTPEAYLLLSQLQMETGKKPQAMASLLQFQKIFPLDFRGSFEMGRLYSAQGEFELAEAELERALEMASENVEVYSLLSKVYEQTGNKDKAIRHALLLCERFPTAAASYEQLASVYERFQMISEAIGAVTRALALSPRDENLYCRRARLHVHAGSYNEAVADFQQAREIDPACPEAKLDTELIRGHKAGRKAFDLYLQGREAADRGDFPQALGLYRQVIQLVPDNVSWLRDMLDVFISLGQFRDASRLFETLLGLDGQDGALTTRAALFHYALGAYDTAFKLFEQAVGLDGANVAARVYVLRGLGHRFLERTVARDRYGALHAAYRENLGRALDQDLARLELGIFHVSVSRHVAPGNEWRKLARDFLGSVTERAGPDIQYWKLRGLYELALLEGNEAERLVLARRLGEAAPGLVPALVASLESLVDGPSPTDEDCERGLRLVEAHGANGYLRSLRMKLLRKVAQAGGDTRGQLRRELRNFQRIVSEEPEGHPGFLDLGLALRYLTLPEEWHESVRRSDIALGKAATLNPGSAWPWWALAKNAAGSPDGEHPGDRSRLKSITFKALRRFPSEPLIHYHAGEQSIESADVTEQETSLRELTCATVLSTEMAPAHLALARHYRRLGQSQAAHHHYVRVTECLCGSRHVPEARAELSKLV
jgi:tetratricopeptide (TPR) repeat protein